MAAWAVSGMGGMVPRMSSRNLPVNLAELAVNCDLSSGAIAAIAAPRLVIDLGTPARRAYRFPNDDGTAEVWLPLPSEFSSVARSPLANDTNRRIYWTNPGADAPFWSTYDLIDAGATPFNLGIVQPSTTVGPIVSVTGGTATPLVSRSYVYTYTNDYGEESTPSAPSEVVSGASDGAWLVNGWPTSAPPNPVGYNYPPVTGIVIYRTVTGQTTGAQFFEVTRGDFPTVPTVLADNSLDTEITNNLALASLGWGNPPVGLDGITALPGGMLVGFVGNTVHFCEPNRPHAWPVGYDQSLMYDIVGLSVWQQSLAVLTTGFPSTGAGNTPSNYTFSQIKVPEPCIARGSIVTDITGVYYASNNGLVVLNYYGMKNQTLNQVTSKQWLNDYHAANIIACRNEAQYLAINATGVGFLIDYSEKRIGFVQLNTFNDAVCVWNDEYDGASYIITPDGKVYVWDSAVQTLPLTYKWRSKLFYTPAPVSVGACQVALDSSVEDAFSEALPLLDNGDASLVLPAGVNAVIKIYAGPDQTYLVTTKQLTKKHEIFRVPRGFKAFAWQFEVVSRVPIDSVELATTMKDLSVA